MAYYLPDTNVLIDFGRVPATRGKLENAQNAGHEFVLGPPAIIELVRGLVAGGTQHFANDKQVFEWIVAQHCKVMPLPRPFMANILKTTSQRRSEVEPEHYVQLVRMLAESATFDEFLRRSKEPDSSWKEIDEADKIHNAFLDREFVALEKIAKRGRITDFAKPLAGTFGPPGRPPNPLILHTHFSAALEFLKASLAKVAGGAKPRKNDPGLYVDFQLLLYLGDPTILFLTKEDFSDEVKKSPQLSRIVHLDSL